MKGFQIYSQKNSHSHSSNFVGKCFFQAWQLSLSVPRPRVEASGCLNPIQTLGRRENEANPVEKEKLSPQLLLCSDAWIHSRQTVGQIESRRRRSWASPTSSSDPTKSPSRVTLCLSLRTPQPGQTLKVKFNLSKIFKKKLESILFGWLN